MRAWWRVGGGAAVVMALLAGCGKSHPTEPGTTSGPTAFVAVSSDLVWSPSSNEIVYVANILRTEAGLFAYSPGLQHIRLLTREPHGTLDLSLDGRQLYSLAGEFRADSVGNVLAHVRLERNALANFADSSVLAPAVTGRYTVSPLGVAAYSDAAMSGPESLYVVIGGTVTPFGLLGPPLAWSPDGTRLLTGPAGAEVILVVASHATTPRPLPAGRASAHWTAAGLQVLSVAGPPWQLTWQNLDTGAHATFDDSLPIVVPRHPWSPDGRKVAWITLAPVDSTLQRTVATLHVGDLTTGASTRVGETFITGAYPDAAFSPDGTRIAHVVGDSLVISPVPSGGVTTARSRRPSALRRGA